MTYATWVTTEKEKQEFRPWSNSLLSAVNMCPTWGVVKYGLQKSYESDARSMALEYGSAAHEVFAAIYCYQVGRLQSLPDHMDFHARRVLNSETRWDECVSNLNGSGDIREELIELAMQVIRTGEFYDDPRDTIRTVTNLEIGCMRYIDEILPNLSKYPIYIADHNNPSADIGVELSFDIMVAKDTEKARFIGQCDRVHEVDGRIILGENKTGSRLDSSWRESFNMAHQVTGYQLALSTVLDKPVKECIVHGMKNKQTGALEDISIISPMDRETEMFEHFIDWVLYSSEVYETYIPDVEKAPRFTHSCNRYFTSCALLPFCTDSPEGRQIQLKQMVKTELSPSEQAILSKVG